MAETTEPQTGTPQVPKPIHSLVVDTGPLIKNDPPVSTLLAQAQELYTLPSVIDEIRDAATRTRVQTTLLPFLKLRNPRPESIQFITGFARRTGDLEVLSKPDIHLLALTYELECERNGGDWRLRKTPAQKRLNGSAPGKEAEKEAEKSTEGDEQQETAKLESAEDVAATETSGAQEDTEDTKSQQPVLAQETVSHQLDSLTLSDASPAHQAAIKSEGFQEDSADTPTEADAAEVANDDDDDGWITPSNLKKHQEKDSLAAPEQPIEKMLQAAILTSDYAMQNVALRINMNLVSPSLARITRVKTWVLRCHGCFHVTREMNKQFCPKCGQATLTRVSCSTDANGNFKVHLKKNFQWNNRGNVYSVPKPVHGTASGKARAPGGGKGGWGKELIFAEDQKEYIKKSDDQRRARQRDLMDEDYLPSILTGDRQGANGRIKVGAGRNINAKKRTT